LLNRDSSSYRNADREMIRSELEDTILESGIEKEADRMAGEAKVLGFDLRYEWEIGVDDGVYAVTEHTYISIKWFYALLGSLFGLSLGFLISLINSLVEPNPYSWIASEPSLLFFGYDIALLICVPALLLLMILSAFTSIIPRPVKEVNEYNVFSSPWTMLIFSVLMISLLGFWGVVFSSLGFTTFSLVVLVVVLVILSKRPNMLLYRDSFSQKTLEEQSSEFGVHNPHGVGSFFDEEIFSLREEWVEFAPPILTKAHLIINFYLATIIIFSGLAIFFVFFFTPGGAILLALNVWFIYRFNSSVSELVGRDVIRLVKRDDNRRQRTAFTLFWATSTIIASYIVLALPFAIAYFFFQTNPISIVSRPSNDLLSSLSVIYIALPLMYPVTGLFYQTVHSLRSYTQFFCNSTPIEEDFGAEASIRRIEKYGSPFCLSTVFNNYIFIPSQILDGEFDKKELEAIIAHEEKHIREGEAVLFLIIPVLSILFFTGQNVIYGLFNFRQRELRADQYAKEKAGKEAIISALNKMKERRSTGEETRLSDLQQHFTLFYGTFAHSKAHPNLQYRIDRLRQSN